MLAEIFSYSFMTRALIVGVLVSLLASLVGVSLVLRKNSMIGDGLSHTAFGAFAIATVLGFAPIYFTIPIVILASFLILNLSKNSKIHGDAAVAILSASSLAIGTLVISISRGVNIDLNSYLFGSILSITSEEVYLTLALAFMVLVLYAVFYNRIFTITFDEDFAKSIGVKTSFYDAVFAAVCSLVVVFGMRILGALLISSLIIFPSLIAMEFHKSFKKVVIFSAIISIINFIIGLILSYLYATPTGATVVIVNLVGFLFVKICRILFGFSDVRGIIS